MSDTKGQPTYVNPECPRCGALVLNEDKHEEWHQELNEAISRTSIPSRIR